MSADSKNLDFVAASVSAIRRDLKAANDAANFRLAELAQNLEDSGAAAAIAAMTKAIEAQTKAIESLKLPEVNVAAHTVNVPQQAPPTVNVTVDPTPITVEAVMPAMPPMPPAQIHVMPAQQKGATWEIRMPGAGYNGADRVMKITRTN